MKIRAIIELLLLLMFPLLLSSQSIVNTVHNLSVSGPGTIKATSEQEICIFCHTPHNSKPLSPLWNRNDPGFIYTLYNSSTLQALPGQPDGSSMLCLSCHDGTIALGSVLSQPLPIGFASGITSMPVGNSNLTTDLSNDHPVSFLYNSSLATSDGQLVDPTSLVGQVRLENEKMQCTSCHDPHKNVYSKFLVASPEFSGLCIICHQQNNWNTASHKNSTAGWNGSGTNPWLHTTYNTVARNACENCHKPHTAGGNIRLMNYAAEEENCLHCHNGNVASKNILLEINKSNSHNVFTYQGIHDPVENAVSSTLHVECTDCHNPHAADNTPAVAPYASGNIKGVTGVTQSGTTINPIQFEYELCYRCHADSPNKPGPLTTRQIVQNNVRLEFATNNPSFHPVSGPGVNPNVPSLIAPLTASSIIYCTDCHASDGSGAPAGPHGSIYPALLKYRYETADLTTESAAVYALCYSCHSRTSILNDESFPTHHTHVVDKRTPCNACHDPHGISSTQGNSTNNTNLINFNTAIVNTTVTGQRRFEDQGLFHGRCYLRCHNLTHNPYTY